MDCCALEESRDLGNGAFPHKHSDRCIGERNREDVNEDMMNDVLVLVACMLDDGYLRNQIGVNASFVY